MNCLEDARRTLAAIRHGDLRPRSESAANEKATPIAEEIAAMPLDEFATADLIVTVYSAALDRRVLFVSDNVPEERIGSPELPVFRASEMKKLAALRPAPSALRTLTEVKAVFRADGAAIEESYRED